MSTKLENRLIEYEKSSPISNDDELIKAIKSIISSEEALSYDVRDYDLIEEAVDAVLTLQGVDIGQLDECAERITDAYFNEIQDAETKIVKNSKAKSVKLKWLIPIAAVLSILVSGTIVAYALGYDLIEITKRVYAQLIENKSYEDGDNELIITSDSKEYYSLSEFLENEEADKLLLPYDLPTEFSTDYIIVTDYDQYKKILFSISGGDFVHSIEIEIPAPNITNSSEGSKQNIGNYTVNYYQYDNEHQAEFIHEENYYTIVSSSYNSLEKIIESLRDNLQ